MKLVINTCFGGFGIKPEIVEKYSLDKYNIRTDKKLIELIESGIDCNGKHARLTVVEIPDEATDYAIEEYDGAESVLYVLDGKIHISEDSNLYFVNSIESEEL